ncbi:MAG: PH domain-containing protein [Solobacterium sp.]|nr:PH domain-containing protein [Solobacterium sp.]
MATVGNARARWEEYKNAKPPVWIGKKCNMFGLPWTFTTYMLNEDCLYIMTGILTHRIDEVRLFRIKDLSLEQTITDRIFGIGTIHIDSIDTSMHSFDLVNIKECKAVRNAAATLIAKARENAKIIEYLNAPVVIQQK